MVKNYFFLFVALTISSAIFAQQNVIATLELPTNNSIRFNKFLLNPTFSFVKEEYSQASFFNRRQWTGFENAPTLYLGTFTGKIEDNSRFGVALHQQDYGIISTFGVVGNYAYGVELDREAYLTFGANLYYYNSGLNTGKVVANDVDPLLNGIKSSSLIALKPGINYGTEFIDFGVSINNLFLYDFKTSKLVKNDKGQSFVGHFMYTGQLDLEGILEESKITGLVQAEKKKDGFGISCNAMLNAPNAGLAQAGYSSCYVVSAGVGVYIKKQFAIGYTFEKSLGNFSTAGPTHEITLAYMFKKYDDERYFEKEAPVFAAQNRVVRKTAQEIADEKNKAELVQAERDRIAAQDAVRKKAQAEALAEKQRLEQDALNARKIADAKALAEANAEKDRLAKLNQDKENAEKIALEAANAKAEQDRLAKEQANADAQEKARLAAEKKEADRLAQEKSAKAKAEQDKLNKEAADKLKADALAAAQEKARLATEKKEAEKLALEAIIKEKAEKARLALEETKRLKAEADAAAKAKADALVNEKAEAARLKAEADKALANKAQQEKEAKEAERLAAINAEKEKAEKERIALEKIQSLKDANSKALDEYKKELDIKNKQSDKLVSSLDSIVKSKEKELQDFKNGESTSIDKARALTAQLENLKGSIAGNKAVYDKLISDFEQKNNQRLKDVKSKGISDADAKELNDYYANTLADLKSKRKKLDDLEKNSNLRIEQIKVEREAERLRRIKLAEFDDLKKREAAEQKVLEEKIRSQGGTVPVDSNKPKTIMPSRPNRGIEIVKKSAGLETGSYLVLDTFKDAETRDQFMVDAGKSGIQGLQTFYNVLDSTYYVYSEKFDEMQKAVEASKVKSNNEYKANMFVIKVVD